MQPPIVIIVSGGVVQDILGMPLGYRVVVKDYDSGDDVDPNNLPEHFHEDDGGIYEELVFQEEKLPKHRDIFYILTIEWRSWERDIYAFRTQNVARTKLDEIVRSEYPDEDGDTDAFCDHGHSWWIEAVGVEEN
jgi:hypothetical protein